MAWNEFWFIFGGPTLLSEDFFHGFDGVLALTVRWGVAVLSAPAFKPVGLDARPVAQNHFVSGGRNVGTGAKGLDEAATGERGERGTLLSAHGANGLDVLGV